MVDQKVRKARGPRKPLDEFGVLTRCNKLLESINAAQQKQVLSFLSTRYS